jgi:hypothetical protein
MSKLKVYIHEGCGHYIGSAVLVAAKNIHDARFFIKEELVKQRLPNEEPDPKEVNMIDGAILYSDNGDY